MKTNITRGDQELNSELELTGAGRDWEVVFESRSDRHRNSDYFEVVRTVIRRFASAGAQLLGAELASGPAMKMPMADRQLTRDLLYPIDLRLEDAESLRLRLSRAQVEIRTSPRRTTGGNGSNRMRLWLRLPASPANDEGFRELILHGAETAEVDEVYVSTPKSAGSSRRSGQGFATDSEIKLRVEAHAMALAAQVYRNEGWAVVDVSSSESYDLHVTKDSTTRYVEVKGTTGTGDAILVTRGSVDLAIAEGRTDLFVVHSIDLVGREAVGGVVRRVVPWRPTSESLTPITYRCTIEGLPD